MRKAIFRKGMVLAIICLFIGAGVISSKSENVETVSNDIKLENSIGLYNGDQLDQQQTEWNYGYGVWNLMGDESELCQSFIPTIPVLTRVFVAAYKRGDPTGELRISIRSSKEGSDLTFATYPAQNIPTPPGYEWIEFDFPDIAVIPGETYYIAWHPDDSWKWEGDEKNIVFWVISRNNPYPHGSMWYSEYHVWEEFADWDACFETYGYLEENQPPEKPSIQSGTSKVVIYSYGFYIIQVNDPNGDEMRLGFDTNEDGTVDQWTEEYYSNGNHKVLLYQGLDKLGTWDLKVKAMDEYGLESEWSYLYEVEIVYTGLLPGSDPRVSKCWLNMYYWHTTGPAEPTFTPWAGSLSVQYQDKIWSEGDSSWLLYFSGNFFTSANEDVYGTDGIPPEITSLELTRTADTDCVPMYPYLRIGGKNTVLADPDPDETLFDQIADKCCQWAIMGILDLFTLGFGSYIVDGAILLAGLEDSDHEPDLIWEPTSTFVKHADGFANSFLRVATDQSSSDGKWWLSFHAGAWIKITDRPGGTELMYTDLNYNGDPYTSDKHDHIITMVPVTHATTWTVGDGAVSFSGPIPPPLEEGQEPEDIIIAVYCPVDVTVYTPSGTYISKDAITYPVSGVTYSEKDINGDGDLDKEIIIPQGWPGKYSIFVKSQEEADPDETFTIIIESEGESITLVDNMKISDLNPNNPFIYEKPMPPWEVGLKGPVKGVPGFEYDYKLYAIDPYELGIYEFLIVWGDDSPDELVTGPFDPDETITVGHIWEEPGNYNIKIKAKDRLGMVSDWSEPLQIDILYDEEASVDIKPGSYPNSINPKSKGKIPVAILTTEDFDASTVDSSTIVFLGVSPVKSVLEDVDNDGDLDMSLKFKTQELDFDLLVEEGDEYPYAYLTGETIDGQSFFGKDTVNLVPPIQKNRVINRPILQFLQNFLEQYPILYQLLQRFLRL